MMCVPLGLFHFLTVIHFYERRKGQREERGREERGTGEDTEEREDTIGGGGARIVDLTGV